MIRNISLLIGLIFCCEAVIAQSSDEKAVSDCVERLRVAMVDADAKVLNELASESLSYGHSGGKVENKSEFLEALVSGKSDFENIELKDQTIRIAGNNAIVRHRLSGRALDGGQASTVNLNVLLVWQKERGKWKLLARQASKVQ